MFFINLVKTQPNNNGFDIFYVFISFDGSVSVVDFCQTNHNCDYFVGDKDNTMFVMPLDSSDHGKSCDLFL